MGLSFHFWYRYLINEQTQQELLKQVLPFWKSKVNWKNWSLLTLLCWQIFVFSCSGHLFCKSGHSSKGYLATNNHHQHSSQSSSYCLLLLLLIFCYDRSQKKATNITTSHFHFSNDRKTAAWYELLLGNDSTCSLQHISDYWNDNDWSWKNATTVFILHTFTFMMTQSGKMRQIFVFSLSLFWWPEREKSDNYFMYTLSLSRWPEIVLRWPEQEDKLNCR